MKRIIVLFVTAAAVAAVAIVCGCIFTSSQISEVTLTEETIAGDRKAACGLKVGFRADSGDDIHWLSSYDYSSGRTESVFKRGEMLEAAESSIYDDIKRDRADSVFSKGTKLEVVETSVYEDIRFTGWSAVPLATRLDYGRLEGLQEKGIHMFYDAMQQRVLESGMEETGKIRLKDYLDYYPVSFRFQLGTNRYDSDNALTGLKIYDRQGSLPPENVQAYDGDIALYVALNDRFRIPVIDNEYHEYSVSKKEGHNPETSLGYETEVKKLSGTGEDYYAFDPVVAMQEGNGKNRMLFIVNNRTRKGVPVDVSQLSGGYGIYELPIEVGAKTIKIGHNTVSVPDPVPLHDEIGMVYPLDHAGEYVEMSLSPDKSCLAVFYVKDGAYFVDLVDADHWTSKGASEMFPASEKMTYAWGGDGSLAVTNHEGQAAVLCRTEAEGAASETAVREGAPYQLLYSGTVGNDFCEAFFDTDMVDKKHFYARYRYGIDDGLAVVTKDGKAALLQNQWMPGASTRNASLECAVIDESGVLYRGRLDNDIVDVKDGMRMDGIKDVKLGKNMIRPVRKENWAEWN